MSEKEVKETKENKKVVGVIVKDENGHYVLEVQGENTYNPMDWLLILEQLKVSIHTVLNANLFNNMYDMLKKEEQNENQEKKQ